MEVKRILEIVSTANLSCFIAAHFGKWCNIPFVIDVCIGVASIALLAVALCMFRPKWLSGADVKFGRVLWHVFVCVCLLGILVFGRSYWP